MRKTTAHFSILLIAVLAFTSCQKSSVEDLQDAQLCLNTVAPASAKGCVAKIASDTSPTANKLRCAAVFISEGYGSTSSFVTAIESLKTPGTCTGGCSSTVNAVTALSFGNNAIIANRAVSLATSDDAFNYCTLSGVPLYQQISALFRLGTLASVQAHIAGSGATPTSTEIKTALGTLLPADLGAIAISTYAGSCQNLNASSDSTKSFCADLAIATAAGDKSPTAVGICFKSKLAGTTTGC